MCQHCRNPLPADKRSDAKFCSSNCRLREFRDRQRKSQAERDAEWRNRVADWIVARDEAIRSGDTEALAEVVTRASEFIGPDAV
jgi:hypothetical protein